MRTFMGGKLSLDWSRRPYGRPRRSSQPSRTVYSLVARHFFASRLDKKPDRLRALNKGAVASLPVYEPINGFSDNELKTVRADGVHLAKVSAPLNLPHWRRDRTRTIGKRPICPCSFDASPDRALPRQRPPASSLSDALLPGTLQLLHPSLCESDLYRASRCSPCPTTGSNPG